MDTSTLHTISVRPNFLKLKVAILWCPLSISLCSALSLFPPVPSSPSLPLYPLSSHSVISCEMKPFSDICGLVIADNHSLSTPLPSLSFSFRECC